MKNGQIWQDTDGNDIQAHGGCIIKHEGVYYWYGEHKGGETYTTYLVSGAAVNRVDVIGISCYSSTDLVNWKYEGLALEANKDDPKSYLHTSRVVERITPLREWELLCRILRRVPSSSSARRYRTSRTPVI